jgi:hypothetical protein
MEGEVLGDGQRGLEGVAGAEIGHAGAMRLAIGVDIGAVPRDRPGAGTQQAGQQAQQRRLAAAIWPPQHQGLAGAQVEIEIAEHDAAGAQATQPADRERRGRGRARRAHAYGRGKARAGPDPGRPAIARGAAVAGVRGASAGVGYPGCRRRDVAASTADIRPGNCGIIGRRSWPDRENAWRDVAASPAVSRGCAHPR